MPPNFAIPEDFKPFDWRGDFWNYERNLPHWRQPGVTYFITFRLNDSLPREVVEAAKRENKPGTSDSHGSRNPMNFSRKTTPPGSAARGARWSR
ncbi:MAG: hypothetical protein LW645_01085 [Verrucomicrobiaceae bacterium]|jgi:hypothetical protein|nr:hypothetical protein [Verrucomicrobiaceae bacterium]